MNSRSTFWIAAAAIFSAALALALAVVAIVRAGDDGAPAAADQMGMGMGMGGSMAGHGAAAPMENVPDATATRGGEVLQPRIENGVWVFELDTKPVRWEILPGSQVTAWTYNGARSRPRDPRAVRHSACGSS